MGTETQITFHGIDHSDALESRIRKRITKLEQHHDRLIACHVRVAADDKRRQKGTNYTVGIDLHVPGRHFVVSQEPGDRNEHEDPYVAVRDAFDALQRQLDEHLRRQRAAHRG